MKTDEAETKRNSLHGETEKSFFWNGKSLALETPPKFQNVPGGAPRWLHPWLTQKHQRSTEQFWNLAGRPSDSLAYNLFQ